MALQEQLHYDDDKKHRQKDSMLKPTSNTKNKEQQLRGGTRI